MAAPAASAASTAGGFWHLDETSGSTAFDASGSGNDATLHGDVKRGLPGHLGTAYSFAADGAWLEVSGAGLDPGTKDFSYSAWVKITDAPGKGETYDIIRKGLAGTRGGEYKLEIVKGGLVRCIAKDENRRRGAITAPRRSAVADGEWHQVGCARDGSAWRVTVDGRTRSRDAGLGSISNTKQLSIGSKYGQQDNTIGLVDEVQLTIG